MALAVAFVACQGAAGLPGETGQPGAPGEPGETPKLAPVIKTPFASVSLMVEGDAAEPIDVSAHFYDPEGEALTYAIAVDPAEGVVTAALEEGMLTIAPEAEGSATITVTATDPDSKSTSASIKVTVAPAGMMPPVRTEVEAPAVSVDVNRIHTIADISRFFSEPEEESLTYSVDVDFPLIATATLTMNEADSTYDLNIRGDAYGTATVTVTATDEDNKTATLEISVTVEKPAPVVPKPDPVRPVVKKAISDRTLYKDDGHRTITLADHFSHERAITYTAESSLSGVVTAVVAEGTLTLTPITPGQNSVVTVTATADSLSISEDFLVTVMAGSKPPPETEPEPEALMADGTIPDQEVEVGESKTVDASMYFTPDTGLDFDTDSSDDDIATADVDASGMVTIEGVKEGDATITVTASNATGSDDQEISVTVIAKRPPHIDDIDMVVTIDGVGDKVNTEKIRTDANQTLAILPTDRTFVSADREAGSATVWILTGKKKTESPVPVSVVNTNRTVEKRIMVTVGNTAPVKETVPRSVLPVSSATSDLADMDGKDLAAATIEKRQYHKVDVPFETIFKDADGADDIKTRHARVIGLAEPYIEVIKVLDEAASPGGEVGDVVIDVKKDVGDSFDLEVYVVDKSGAESSKELLSVSSPTPLADVYEVSQNLGDGDFPPLEVHLRQGVLHTLTLVPYDDGDASDFRFINVFESDQLGGMELDGTVITQGDLEAVPSTGLPSATATTAPTLAAYLTAKGTGVNIGAGKAASATVPGWSIEGSPARATLRFMVTESGPARVVFTYNRLVYNDAIGETAGVSEPAERKWLEDSETLGMIIR